MSILLADPAPGYCLWSNGLKGVVAVVLVRVVGVFLHTPATAALSEYSCICSELTFLLLEYAIVLILDEPAQMVLMKRQSLRFIVCYETIACGC